MKLKRAASDTIQWRIIASSLDAAVILMFTGSLWKAGSLAIVLLVVKTIAFFTWRIWRET